jgi:hypothetical protein
MGLREFVAMESHPFVGRVFACPRCRKPCYRLYDANGWAVIHATNQVPVNQKTSTEKMAEALDQLIGITDREKELRHRDGLTEEETAELVALEDAREAKRQRNYQEWRQKRLAAR